MKYVIRAAPILVALALFVSFLVVQQDNTARAAVVGLDLSYNAGTDAGTTTNPSHVSSNSNVVTTSRKVLVSVTDDAATVAPIVTVKNDTSGDSITLVVAGGSAPSTPWTGSFVVKDPSTSPNTATEIQAEDGDVIQVTVGFLIASLTVDSDPPDMNPDLMIPADGAISGDGLTAISGKVDDPGAGVAEADISVWSAPTAGTLSRVPAALISFTETAAEDGFTFSTFINIPTDGTQKLQFQAIDGAGNALFSDSDDTTDCEVDNGVTTADTLTVVTGTVCDVNNFDVDTVAPILADAFTGLAFDEDSSDCDSTLCLLDENERDWILAEFTDASSVLDGSSVDLGDFLVDGDTPKAVKWFDEDGTVENAAGDSWVIKKVVFIQLDAAQTADATPQINLTALAGGVQDEAVNIRTSGEVAAAKDRIGPLFQVDDFDPPPSSASLAGDEVEVSFTLTADEETDTKPTVTVWDVFSPGTTADLPTTVTTAGTNRWKVVVDEVAADKATIYNVFISGEDTSGNTADLGIENVDAVDPEDLDDDDLLTGGEGTAEGDGIIDGFFETITDTEDATCGTSTDCDDFSSFSAADIDEDATYFEGDTKDLGAPTTVPAEDADVDIRSPFFLSLDWTAVEDEFEEDSHGDVDLIFAELDGVDVLASASTADGSKWLIAIRDILLGPHELKVNASDDAGNDLEDGEFTLKFEVTARAAIEVALSPGWNLVSLPGNPADPSIDAVMANTPSVEAVITYDPTVPGGFLVALRTEDGGDFSGTLTTMSASRGYWVLTDNFEPIKVDVPPLGQGAGVLPPSVPVAPGWNLLPVQDPTGAFDSGDALKAKDYFTSAEDVSAVYEFDTIGNAWVFIDITDTATIDCDAKTKGAAVVVGKSYWAFSTEKGTLVPVPISADATTSELSSCP